MARATTLRRRIWFGGFYRMTMDATEIWLRHTHSRRELARLNRRDLADIGLWRIDAEGPRR